MKQEDYNDDDEGDVEDVKYLLKRVQETPLTPSTSAEFDAMVKAAMSSFASSAIRFKDAHDKIKKEIDSFEQNPEHKKYFKQGEFLPFEYVKNLKDLSYIKDLINDTYIAKSLFANEVRIKYKKGYNALRGTEIMSEALKQQKDLHQMQLNMVKESMDRGYSIMKDLVTDNREFMKKEVFDYANVMAQAVNANTEVLRIVAPRLAVSYSVPKVEKPEFNSKTPDYSERFEKSKPVESAPIITPINSEMLNKANTKRNLNLPDLQSLESEQELEDDDADLESEGDDVNEE